MKIHTIAIFGLASLMLSGCVTHHPQTAQEFREAVPGAFLAEVETFVVDRAFEDVANTFETKGPECLDVTVTTTSQTNMSYQVIVTNYNPSVHVSTDKAELHLQQHHEKGVLNITEEPDGGYYLLVADAYPVANSQTRVDLYRPSVGHKVLLQAIKNWATGENIGCPDMTKI